MKKLVLLITVSLLLVNCKMIMKGAAKYWTKKQVKEFVANCEEQSSKFIGAEKAKHYCDCAVDEIAEKYHNYEDVKKMGIMEAMKIAKNCREGENQ